MRGGDVDEPLEQTGPSPLRIIAWFYHSIRATEKHNQRFLIIPNESGHEQSSARCGIVLPVDVPAGLGEARTITNDPMATDRLPGDLLSGPKFGVPEGRQEARMIATDPTESDRCQKLCGGLTSAKRTKKREFMRQFALEAVGLDSPAKTLHPIADLRDFTDILSVAAQLDCWVAKSLIRSDRSGVGLVVSKGTDNQPHRGRREHTRFRIASLAGMHRNPVDLLIRTVNWCVMESALVRRNR